MLDKGVFIEKSELFVKRIKSRYHGSNTFIIQNTTDRRVVIVDPGDPDISLVIQFMEQIQGEIEAVWLTHEHSDHCAGVNALYAWQPFELYCSKLCAKNVLDPKKNFSLYIDEIQTFIVEIPAFIVDNEVAIAFNGKKVSFFETPGHTTGSGCFWLPGMFFSGDTFMKDFKTPLNLPGSNKKDFHESVTFIQTLLSPDDVIFPGHGEAFTYSSIFIA